MSEDWASSSRRRRPIRHFSGGSRYAVDRTSDIPHPTSIQVSHRHGRWLTGLLALALACDSPTAPTPDFDISRYPYVVSSQGVRHFGTSRLLVIPARFHDGAPMTLTSAELQAQLFGGAGGGPLNQAFSLASGGAF